MPKFKFTVNNKGAVLITGLMFLLLISVLATTAYLLSTTDVFISENYKLTEQAFNDAEAGVQYGIAKLERALESGMILPTNGSVNIPGSAAPSDFSFTLSPLTIDATASNLYHLTAVGAASKGATSQIDVTLKRSPAISFGAFGDEIVDSKNSALYYSYNSNVVPNPTPLDSTGECDVGSNGTVSVKMGTTVDGDVLLGNDGTADASYAVTGVPIVSGDEGVTIGRVDPDPLNVDSAAYRSEFDTAAIVANNDNADIIPLTAITGTTISNPSSTVTIPSQAGGSTYYLEGLQLGNSDILNVDASNGPITIYIRGTLVTNNSSQINILNATSSYDVTIKLTEDPSSPLSTLDKIVDLKNNSSLNVTGSPTSFSIMTDSDAKVDFHNSSDVKGLVYAPNANVIMHNSSSVYGAVWANDLDGKNSSVLYYDEALKDKYLSNNVNIVSWKKVLN